MTDMPITTEERGWITIMRINKLLDKKEIRKKVCINRLEVFFLWRSKKNLWGRFGGGWNWKLGFQAGGKTLIVSFLIADVMLTLKSKKEADDDDSTTEG